MNKTIYSMYIVTNINLRDPVMYSLTLGWAEPRTQVDQRIARKFLFPHRLGDTQNLSWAIKRPVRLHVPERPERRQFRPVRVVPSWGRTKLI